VARDEPALFGASRAVATEGHLDRPSSRLPQWMGAGRELVFPVLLHRSIEFKFFFDQSRLASRDRGFPLRQCRG